MKLDLATAHQILLELSEADLLRFGLSMEQLLVPSSHTRSQLCCLLAALAQETGQCFQLSRNTRVDVLPDLYGGCLLIVSDCVRVETPDLPCAFYTQEINALIDAARSVFKHRKPPRVTLLQMNDGFLLLAKGLPKQVRHQLLEYLNPVYLTAAACAVLREHSVVLLDDQPLSTLCGGA